MSTRTRLTPMLGMGAALAVFLCLSACRTTAGSAPAVDGDREIAAILEPILHSYRLPAMAAALVTSRGVEAVGVVGVRKAGTDVAATAADLWHLGSDTKAMTAALVGTLVERGALGWDTRVAEVFPELSPSFHSGFARLTIRELLCHRGGVPANLDWGRISGTGTTAEQRVAAVKEALSQAPESPPGSRYLYSNLGYVIVGAVVERVTGKSWEEALAQEIFAPLGMASAGQGGTGTPGQIDQPWGHLDGGEPVSANGPSMDNPPVLGPAGRVHASIGDWGAFVADVLRGARGEKALLRASTYRTILTPPSGGDYALGWIVAEREWGGGKVLNHVGSNTMNLANVWIAPRRDFALLVCINRGLDSFEASDRAMGELIRWWEGRSRGAH